MKHTSILITLFCFLIITSSSNCLKEPFKEKLPPVTQEGKNTFGCFVDGNPFIPGETLFGNITPLSCYYYYDSTNMYKAGSLFIQGIAVNNEVSGDIFIQKINVFGTGKYNLRSDSCLLPYQCNGVGYYKKNEGTDYVGQGVTYFAITGELVITKQ
jgi:hypothetical protein